MLSDAELIQEFIDNSIQGKEVLLANRSLRAQRVCDSNQLFEKAGTVVLSAQLQQTPIQFLVRSNSPYWVNINAALATRSYLSVGSVDDNGFYVFQYCKLPAGYQMYCTPANYLWRAWWQYRKHLSRNVIPLDLLIRSRSTWYPIRDIVCGQGFLYIKTLGSEIDVTLDDLICWLRKIPPSS